MGNNGDAVVAWMDLIVPYTAGGNTIDLKTAVYVAGAWQLPQVLDQDPESFPQLSDDPSGATVAHLVWSAADGVRSSSYRVGSGWSVPTSVPLALPGASSNYWRSASGIDAGGAALVIAETPDSLRAVRCAAGVCGPVNVVQSFGSIAIRNPYLAVGVNGHAVAAWWEPLATGIQVWAAYYDGAMWQPPVLLKDPTVPFANGIQIEVGSDGSAVVVWGSTHASRYRNGVWDTTVLSAGATPHLAMNANGDTRVVWAEGVGEVWSRHFSGAQPWSAPVQLTDPRTSAPLVELAPDGKPILVWAEGTGVWSMIMP